MNRFYKVSTIAISLGLSSISAHAINPAEVKAGPVAFIPTFAFDIENNSNIYRASENSSTGEYDATIYRFRPDVTMKAENNDDVYYGTLYIEAGVYSDSLDGDDDYTDIGLLTGADMVLNSKILRLFPQLTCF